jgi:hypothetical protein
MAGNYVKNTLYFVSIGKCRTDALESNQSVVDHTEKIPGDGKRAECCVKAITPGLQTTGYGRYGPQVRAATSYKTGSPQPVVCSLFISRESRERGVTALT